MIYSGIHSALTPLASASNINNDVELSAHGPTITMSNLSYTIGSDHKTMTMKDRISNGVTACKDVIGDTANNFISLIKGEGMESDNRRNTYSISAALKTEDRLSLSSFQSFCLAKSGFLTLFLI